MVGSGQLYVVQRLSSREFDVAGVEKIYRSRPRALAGRRAQETCLHKRGEALRHANPAAVTGGVPVSRRNSLTRNTSREIHSPCGLPNESDLLHLTLRPTCSPSRRGSRGGRDPCGTQPWRV